MPHCCSPRLLRTFEPGIHAPTSKVRKLRVKEFEASCPSPPDRCGDAGSQPNTFGTDNTTTEAGVHSGPKSESGLSAGGVAGTGTVASQETDAPGGKAAGPFRDSHSPGRSSSRNRQGHHPQYSPAHSALTTCTPATCLVPGTVLQVPDLRGFTVINATDEHTSLMSRLEQRGTWGDLRSPLQKVVACPCGGGSRGRARGPGVILLQALSPSSAGYREAGAPGGVWVGQLWAAEAGVALLRGDRWSGDGALWEGVSCCPLCTIGNHHRVSSTILKSADGGRDSMHRGAQAAQWGGRETGAESWQAHDQ